MLRQPSPIDEHAATGETARIYHDIRQTLRVSGVSADDIPGTRFEPIPKARLFVMIDRPRVVVGLLLEFLSGSGARA